jgi:hypothetical protein
LATLTNPAHNAPKWGKRKVHSIRRNGSIAEECDAGGRKRPLATTVRLQEKRAVVKRPRGFRRFHRPVS